MAIGPKKTKGKTLSVGRINRKQKRRPRRLVEAGEKDWQIWDAACKVMGLNFAEFARRALMRFAADELEAFNETPKGRAMVAATARAKRLKK